jgi:hypothetical protein
MFKFGVVFDGFQAAMYARTVAAFLKAAILTPKWVQRWVEIFAENESFYKLTSTNNITGTRSMSLFF